MAIRHREVFPVGSSPDSIAWDIWNDEHVGDAAGLPQDQIDALDAATAPDGSNPFATIADVGIQTARVQLTDAQIKTMSASPVTLVANPGAGLMIVPSLLHIVIDTRAGAYVAVGGSEVAMTWANNDGLTAPIPVVVQNAFMQAAALNFDTFIMASKAYSGEPRVALDGSAQEMPLVSAQALVIGNYADPADPPAAEWAGGDPANTLSVYVEYRVLPTTPFA